MKSHKLYCFKQKGDCFGEIFETENSDNDNDSSSHQQQEPPTKKTTIIVSSLIELLVIDPSEVKEYLVEMRKVHKKLIRGIS